jgi:DNA-binding LytR/AlgR family response regulator
MLFDAERQYYLWPPFSKERVTKAIEQLSARKSRPHAPAMSIVVSGRAGDLVLPADDIIYCESEKRITYFYTADEKSKMYVKLSDVEEMLAGRFIRCHQSFLVNFSYIKRVGKADIELTNGKFIPISQRKRSKVLAAIEALGRGEMS